MLVVKLRFCFSKCFLFHPHCWKLLLLDWKMKVICSLTLKMSFHCLLASIVAIEKTAVNGVVLFLQGSVFPFWLLSSFYVVVLQLDYSTFRRGVFFILPALGLVGILESEDWCLSLILEKFQSNSIKSWLFLIICSPSETSIKLLLDGPHHSTLHLP